jgi:gentisate 1,2-dioxygenase
MIWLDGLDVPLINKLGLTFSEQFDGDRYPQSKPDGYSQAVYGHGFVPLGKQFTNDLPRHHAPQLAYPYGEAIQALRLMMEAGAPDPICGYKLRYTNSATGGHILPTIGAFLQLLPSDFSTKRRRSTDATVFCVLSGRGRTQIDDSIIDWEPNDVFVVPNWTWHSHIAVDEAILFSFSDCALQQSLNLWREEFEASAATS